MRLAPAAVAAAAALPASGTLAGIASTTWLITARDLLGKRVVATLEPGQELGMVYDFLVEGANGGQVRYIVLRTVGTLDTTFLGGTRDVIVPVAALHFAGRGDMARPDL